MLNKGVLYVLIFALALLASPALVPPPVAADDILVVDDDGPPFCAPVSFAYTTITQALAAANNGDTIWVCDGDYTEGPLVITDDYLTITGPGATSESDGVATVHHNGISSAMFIIQADWVTVEGLDLDATPPQGFPSSTTGIEINGPSVTIQDNEIRNATSSAVSPYGASRYVQIINNNIHDNQDGVICYVEDCVVAGNTINVTDRALEMVSDRGNITNNIIVHGRVSASGDNLFISTNEITGAGATVDPLLAVSGNYVSVVDNTLSDSTGYGLEVDVGPSGGSVTIARNTFARITKPIWLRSWGVGLLDATIGGSQADANTFIDSGEALGDSNYLLALGDIQTNINAEYNDWGLCTAAEIEQEIHDQVDDPTEGLVDFEPFIPPSGCSPTPTATRTPTPTPTATATATPGPTRAVTIPADSWANFAWIGDSSPQTVADCFGAGNVAVMYRLDAATQTFQRWIRGRDDLSNMTDVLRYDALLALNASAQPATCTMPDVLLARSLTIPAGSWANFAWTGGASLSAEGAAQCFGEGNVAVMYRLDAFTQTFERWIRGRQDLSNMTDVARFDALLALNGSDQPATCHFPVLAMSGLLESGQAALAGLKEASPC